MKLPVDLPEGAVAYLIRVATKPRSLSAYYRALACLDAMSETDLKRLLKRYRNTPEKVDARALGRMLRKAMRKAPTYAGRFAVDRSVLDQLSGRDRPAGTLTSPNPIAFIRLHRDAPNRPLVATMTVPALGVPSAPPRPDDVSPAEWAAMDRIEAKMIPRAQLLELAATRRPPDGRYDDEDRVESAR